VDARCLDGHGAPEDEGGEGEGDDDDGAELGQREPEVATEGLVQQEGPEGVEAWVTGWLAVTTRSQDGIVALMQDAILAGPAADRGVPAAQRDLRGECPVRRVTAEDALTEQFERGLAALLDGLAARMNIS
jgi:hypothetical protein